MSRQKKLGDFFLAVPTGWECLQAHTNIHTKIFQSSPIFDIHGFQNAWARNTPGRFSTSSSPGILHSANQSPLQQPLHSEQNQSQLSNHRTFQDSYSLTEAKTSQSASKPLSWPFLGPEIPRNTEGKIEVSFLLCCLCLFYIMDTVHIYTDSIGTALLLPWHALDHTDRLEGRFSCWC